jgi:tripartite-type tricarboxylate transporter receptor subunit TctC
MIYFILLVSLVLPWNCYSAQSTTQTTIIVPYPPGGTVDLVARLIARMATEDGHSVTIENRSGAEGRIPYKQFANIRKQSNTLLMGASGPMYFAPLLADNDSGYNTVTSFKPIIHLGKAYHFILSHPSTQILGISGLIKQKNLIFASGNATSRFMLEYLFIKSGMRATVVPYNGGGPAFIAMMSGYVPFGAETTPSAIQHVKSGKLNAIAITSLKRIPQADSIPTINETIKDFEVYSTYALLGTIDIPDDMIKYYNTIFNAVLRNKDKFYDFHIETTGGLPEYLENDIKTQITRWTKIKEQL